MGPTERAICQRVKREGVKNRMNKAYNDDEDDLMYRRKLC